LWGGEEVKWGVRKKRTKLVRLKKKRENGEDRVKRRLRIIGKKIWGGEGI